MHFDAILRTDNEVWDRIFPALAAFTINPRGLEALVAILGNDDPPWRRWFLTRISERLANEDRLSQLYRDLRSANAPLTADELQPFFARLIKAAKFDEAYETWVSRLPPLQRSSSGHPYNGDFAIDPDGSPFDWVWRSAPGTDFQLANLDATAGRALRIQFSGARVGTDLVTQLMRLPPGTYRLTGKLKADLRTQRGLWWRISCANILKVSVSPQILTLSQSPLIDGRAPWRPFGVNFTVPEAGCPAQWLRPRTSRS